MKSAASPKTLFNIVRDIPYRDLTHPYLCISVYLAVNIAASFVFFFVASELSLPVSRMWQRWVRRSSKGVVIFASPKTCAHSLKLGLVVMITLVRS